jgi:cobalt/nickel transport system permease protein
MHIAEGYLPMAHAAGWWVASAPALYVGWRQIQVRMEADDRARLHLGAATGFLFVLSALKLPSFAGSSSHPTGCALGALLLGPAAVAPLGAIVLFFQALLLAHGGFTTLGANIFSMAICGPWVAWAVYRLGRRMQLPTLLSVFAAGFAGGLSPYLVTALQLGLAYPDAASGVQGAWLKFTMLFAPTQLPLALLEGGLTALVWRTLRSPEWNTTQAPKAAAAGGV